MNQLVWYRSDLRVHDHPALQQAVAQARKNKSRVIALYCWCDHYLDQCGAGTPKRAAIVDALQSLAASLGQLGIRLHLLSLPRWQALPEPLEQLVIEETITDIHFHNEPGIYETDRDRVITEALHGLNWHRYHDLFLLPPEQQLNLQGQPYKVFTAYKKSVLAQQDAWLQPPLAKPKPIGRKVTNKLTILAHENWQNPLALPVTEAQAHKQLMRFLEQVANYKEQRDLPAVAGTSQLSVALANGVITSRQIAWALTEQGTALSSSVYFSEILWREFFKYITLHHPYVCRGDAFAQKNDQFPWRTNEDHLVAWQQGQTGVPIVDAAMQQLNQTGWMHNRLRMVCAMYLSKILQLNWRDGERYFARQLADFDFCANNGGWQWSASTGVDAAPYFRIFNPYSQSTRFDQQGAFIRHYLPALTSLSNKDIHQPTDAQCHQLGYPNVLIDYSQARQDTLEKFKRLAGIDR